MTDLAHRFKENPLLTPADIAPSTQGMEVTCLLNPGVFEFQGTSWLLLRVAERPIQTPGKASFPVLTECGTIKILVIDIVSRIEGRNQYAYIFNCEFALFFGRLLGCSLFIGLAYFVSDIAALKYALPVIAAVQLLSIGVTRSALSQVDTLDGKLSQPIDPVLIQGVAP